MTLTIIRSGIPWAVVEEATDQQIQMWFLILQEQQSDLVRALQGK